MNKLCLAIIVVTLSACVQDAKDTNPIQKLSKEERFEISQNSLKQVLQREQKQIQNFIKRKGGTFTESATGVHYYIYNSTTDTLFPQPGNQVLVSYELKLLNGKVISAKSTNDKIVLDYDEKESGLHETLKKMKLNEKAIVIIPSHRAHGLVGNSKDIPSLSTLVYDIEIQGIE